MQVYTKNLELIEKETESKLLLFNVNSGRMFELNETATLLWMRTGESFSIAELKEIISRYCKEIHNVDQDVEGYILTALEKNLIN